MIFQLPNGKSIEISLEQYLRMSDEDLEYYIASNMGQEIHDPFHGSVLKNGFIESPIEDIDDDLIIDEPYLELTDIPDEDKLYDPDYINEDELDF